MNFYLNLQFYSAINFFFDLKKYLFLVGEQAKYAASSQWRLEVNCVWVGRVFALLPPRGPGDPAEILRLAARAFRLPELSHWPLFFLQFL